LSINRIAADDDPSTIVAVFHKSLDHHVHQICEAHGILALQAHEVDLLYRQLYGSLERPTPC
jgi:hypothetical protein